VSAAAVGLHPAARRAQRFLDEQGLTPTHEAELPEPTVADLT
jgi:hypothetical protein